MSELHYASIAAVAGKLRSGDVSSVELTQSLLARIESLNGEYHAYSNVMSSQALEQASIAARDIARGHYRGPLHGIPVAVKDLLDIAGQPTTCASLIRQNHVASTDATVVRKLKEAGAVILGKLNMTEFALSGYNPQLPVPVNPWGKDRWSGVSSSGSAVATALGLAFGTLGSDTGGSIRFPAAVNGVVGLKPTFGRVSKAGAFPLSFTLDHIGPITRTVADAAILFEAIEGYDSEDPFSVRPPAMHSQDSSGDIAGMRLGIDEAYCAHNTHPEVAQSVIRAARELERKGVELVPVDMMSVLKVCDYWGAVVASEAALMHQSTYPSRAQEYGPVFRDALGAAASVSGTLIAEARLEAAHVRAFLNQLLESVDALICPGAPLPAMPLSEFPPSAVTPPESTAAMVGFTAPTNFSGHPTLSLPGGLSSEGLPLGLQLIGPHFGEHLLLKLGIALESTQEPLVPPVD